MHPSLLTLAVAVTIAAPVPKAKKVTYHFPTIVGMKWTMTSEQERIESSVTEVVTVDNEVRVTVRTSNGKRKSEEGWIVTTEGVWKSYPQVDFKIRHRLLKLPASVGDQVERKSDQFFVQICETTGLEMVTVPAGKFEAVRVDEWINFKGKEIDRTTFWFAPEVGIVKKCDNGKEWVLTSFEKDK